MDDSKSRKYKYKVDEEVLCYHGPKVYNAKCLQVRTAIDNIPEYFVHYQGWNKKWDEWVTDERILKKENRNVISVPKKGKISENFKPAAIIPATAVKPKPKKRRSMVGVSNAPVNQAVIVDIVSKSDSDLPIPLQAIRVENFASARYDLLRNDVQIIINSTELCEFLVEDLEKIMEKNKFLVVPQKKTVSEITKEYIRFCRTNHANKIDVYKQHICANSIRRLFDVLFSSKLLYVPERSQYKKIKKKFPQQLPSELYGLAHLFRCFIVINRMLQCTDMNNLDSIVDSILKYLNFLLDYKNKITIDYIVRD